MMDFRAILLMLLVTSQAWAQTVRDIAFEGNRKIEAESLKVRLQSKLGSPVDPTNLEQDIQALFKTGFFQDIQVFKEPLEADGVRLIYQLVEKPSVNEIIFKGYSEMKEEELLEASGLKAFEIYDHQKVKSAVEKIQKKYEDKGFYLAKITPRIEPITEGETLRLVFDIIEDEKVQVKQISILGNQKLSDGTIKGRLMTTEGGYFSFVSNSGSYKQDAFDRDMQIIKFLYLNEGYIDAKIDPPVVTVSPDRKGIYITIRVSEGEQYKTGDIDFSGDLLFNRSELEEVTTLKEGAIFSQEVLQKDLSALQAKYGDLGYAYTNVIPRLRKSEAERKVDLTFEFDKGNKVYFGLFTITGNSKTRDKVIRRELKIFEGELYNETRRRESFENIRRLGFFEDVNFKTSSPPEEPDVMNVEIVVKERSTGQIVFGAGYGSATGANLNGSISQTNWLGKGQKLNAGLNLSRDENTYNFGFTEPNFNDTDWLVGFNAFQSASGRFDYLEYKRGASLQLGHPIGEFLSASLRWKYERTDLEPVTDRGQIITDQTIFPMDQDGDTSSLTGILEYDKRNDRFSPSEGIYASASLEYAGLGGHFKYTRGSTTFRYFHNVFWDVVWRNNLNYSIIAAHDGGEPPFNELFLLGGPYSLRGYRFFRVGKTKFSQQTKDRLVSEGATPEEAERRANRSFGGRQQFLYQSEFEFPLIKEAGIKGVAFFDIGQAEDVITGDGFYSDVGFGFRWFSPIGPLRFEWGFPLRTIPTSPDPMNFEFSIGTPF